MQRRTWNLLQHQFGFIAQSESMTVAAARRVTASRENRSGEALCALKASFIARLPHQSSSNLFHPARLSDSCLGISVDNLLKSCSVGEDNTEELSKLSCSVINSESSYLLGYNADGGRRLGRLEHPSV